MMSSRAKLPLRRGNSSQGELWEEREVFEYTPALRNDELRPSPREYQDEDEEEVPGRRFDPCFEERAQVFGQAPPDED
jgi:hypothetical protein